MKTGIAFVFNNALRLTYQNIFDILIFNSLTEAVPSEKDFEQMVNCRPYFPSCGRIEANQYLTMTMRDIISVVVADMQYLPKGRSANLPE